VLLSGPVGLVLGFKALREIKNSKGRLKGRRLAIEGIVLSIVLEFIFFAIAFVIADITKGYDI